MGSNAAQRQASSSFKPENTGVASSEVVSSDAAYRLFDAAISTTVPTQDGIRKMLRGKSPQELDITEPSGDLFGPESRPSLQDQASALLKPQTISNTTSDRPTLAKQFSNFSNATPTQWTESPQLDSTTSSATNPFAAALEKTGGQRVSQTAETTNSKDTITSPAEQQMSPADLQTVARKEQADAAEAARMQALDAVRKQLAADVAPKQQPTLEQQRDLTTQQQVVRINGELAQKLPSISRLDASFAAEILRVISNAAEKTTSDIFQNLSLLRHATEVVDNHHALEILTKKAEQKRRLNAQRVGMAGGAAKAESAQVAETRKAQDTFNPELASNNGA